MSPTAFVYWLQGLLELEPDLKTLNEEQVKQIRQHLGYVFERKAAHPKTPTLSPLVRKAIKELMERDAAREEPDSLSERMRRGSEMSTLRLC